MAYSEKVLDHYSNPQNVGTLDKSKSNVGTGLVGAPECGDVMRLQIEVIDNIIIDAKFKTFGCGSAIASSSLATEWIKGMEIDKAEKITNKEIAQELFLVRYRIEEKVSIIYRSEDVHGLSQKLKLLIDAKIIIADKLIVCNRSRINIIKRTNSLQ